MLFYSILKKRDQGILCKYTESETIKITLNHWKLKHIKVKVIDLVFNTLLDTFKLLFLSPMKFCHLFLWNNFDKLIINDWLHNIPSSV